MDEAHHRVPPAGIKYLVTEMVCWAADQNPALFANSWMANKLGQPRPDFEYHRWGGSLSGPLRLRRGYGGANRTFLWGYEGIHERRPRTLRHRSRGEC